MQRSRQSHAGSMAVPPHGSAVGAASVGSCIRTTSAPVLFIDIIWAGLSINKHSTAAYPFRSFQKHARQAAPEWAHSCLYLGQSQCDWLYAIRVFPVEELQTSTHVVPEQGWHLPSS